MEATADSGESRPLRADAIQNRDRILAAARDVFVEQGAGAPLEEISRRAGTGIATLYRRFPDREALMKAVVLDALQRSADEAREAVDEESDPFDALVRYMHRALDIRTAAVIPALLDVVPLDDEELQRAREQGSRRFEEMVSAAHRAGKLHPDVTAADIGILIVRLSRPLPGSFPRELHDRLAHRHVDLLIQGLRAPGDREAAVSGPAITLAELQAMTPESRS
jgi:AcrR family transcriptional regulator